MVQEWCLEWDEVVRWSAGAHQATGPALPGSALMTYFLEQTMAPAAGGLSSSSRLWEWKEV